MMRLKVACSKTGCAYKAQPAEESQSLADVR